MNICDTALLAQLAVFTLYSLLFTSVVQVLFQVTPLDSPDVDHPDTRPGAHQVPGSADGAPCALCPRWSCGKYCFQFGTSPFDSPEPRWRRRRGAFRRPAQGPCSRQERRYWATPFPTVAGPSNKSPPTSSVARSAALARRRRGGDRTVWTCVARRRAPHAPVHLTPRIPSTLRTRSMVVEAAGVSPIFVEAAAAEEEEEATVVRAGVGPCPRWT